MKKKVTKYRSDWNQKKKQKKKEWTIYINTNRMLQKKNNERMKIQKINKKDHGKIESYVVKKYYRNFTRKPEKERDYYMNI